MKAKTDATQMKTECKANKTECGANKVECGAKTRAGTPCRRSPMPNGRCSKHGGKSPLGIGHPRFKHGYYSRDFLTRVVGTITLLREAGAVVETMGEMQAAMRMTPLHSARKPKQL